MTDRSMDDLLAALEADATLDAGVPFLALAAKHFQSTREGEGAVSTPYDVKALAARFAEAMPTGTRSLEQVVERLDRDVMGDVNRLTHPMYLGHQVSAPIASAVWSEVVTSAVNNSLAVWEMSPVGTVVEERVIAWMAGLAGYGATAADVARGTMEQGSGVMGAGRAGGTFTSGGTEASLTALLAARAAAVPDSWRDGVRDELALVHGEHAHYAVARAAGILGLGSRNAVTVPARDWRMQPDDLAATLERLHREGRRVMAVVATSGHTATGAFDDLARIGEVCDRFGVWLHVDGAHGASALLSARHRHRMNGSARARTIAWDPHKMMLMPLSAGMLLARDERDLGAAFAQRAPYLFHGAEGERGTDIGPRSLQCSRRADALKVWVALQRLGADGIGALYDRLCDLTATLHAMLAERPTFERIHAPESNILCFRHAGDDAHNQVLRERYNRSGRGWITSTMLEGRRVLRVTIMNPRTTEGHLERLLDGLEAEAKS